MLCTVSHFLSFAVLLSSVAGAPHENKIRRHIRNRPWHGPPTASGTTTATSTTYPGGNAYGDDTYPTPSQPYNASSTPGNGFPSSGSASSVADEGRFYAQTTMPPPSTNPYQAGEFYQQRTPSVNEEAFNAQPTLLLDLQRAAVGDSQPSNEPQPSGGPTVASGKCPTAQLTPQCYRLASQFPSSNEWMSWECLVGNSRPDMVGSSNDGPDEADAIIAAVESVAQAAGIDPYVLLQLNIVSDYTDFHQPHPLRSNDAGILRQSPPHHRRLGQIFWPLPSPDPKRLPLRWLRQKRVPRIHHQEYGRRRYLWA